MAGNDDRALGNPSAKEGGFHSHQSFREGQWNVSGCVLIEYDAGVLGDTKGG
jgi:hypothetical protein